MTARAPHGSGPLIGTAQAAAATGLRVKVIRAGVREGRFPVHTPAGRLLKFCPDCLAEIVRASLVESRPAARTVPADTSLRPTRRRLTAAT